MFGIPSVLFWLIAVVIFAIIEAVTVGLASIWFAIGGVAAMIAATFHASFPIQVLVFIVVSILLLLSTRRIAVKYIYKQKIATNADSLIGLTAVVEEDIDNFKSKGLVKVKGQMWSARSKDDQTIESGKKIKILKIEGVKLIVEPIEDVV